MLRRLMCLLIICTSLLSLVSCGKDKLPVNYSEIKAAFSRLEAKSDVAANSGVHLYFSDRDFELYQWDSKPKKTTVENQIIYGEYIYFTICQEKTVLAYYPLQAKYALYRCRLDGSAPELLFEEGFHGKSRAYYAQADGFFWCYEYTDREDEWVNIQVNIETRDIQYADAPLKARDAESFSSDEGENEHYKIKNETKHGETTVVLTEKAGKNTTEIPYRVLMEEYYSLLMQYGFSQTRWVHDGDRFFLICALDCDEYDIYLTKDGWRYWHRTPVAVFELDIPTMTVSFCLYQEMDVCGADATVVSGRNRP